jgi:hypothetical protein
MRRARLWKWSAFSVGFALVPFALKALAALSYDIEEGFWAFVLALFGRGGRGDLSLMAMVLTCSALGDLFLLDRRNSGDRLGLFIVTVLVAVVAVGYYASVSSDFPNPRSPNNVVVAVISGAIYLAAVVSSWYCVRVSEQERLNNSS